MASTPYNRKSHGNELERILKSETFRASVRLEQQRLAAQRPRNPEPVLPVEATDVDFSE